MKTLTKFHAFTLDTFKGYRTGPKNWKKIPIEFLGIFRRFIEPSQYKLNFQGHDPKGRPSYLKLYAKTFSVSYRTTQVQQMEERQLRMEVRRIQKRVAALQKAI